MLRCDISPDFFPRGTTDTSTAYCILLSSSSNKIQLWPNKSSFSSQERTCRFYFTINRSKMKRTCFLLHPFAHLTKDCSKFITINYCYNDHQNGILSSPSNLRLIIITNQVNSDLWQRFAYFFRSSTLKYHSFLLGAFWNYASFLSKAMWAGIHSQELNSQPLAPHSETSLTELSSQLTSDYYDIKPGADDGLIETRLLNLNLPPQHHQ